MHHPSLGLPPGTTSVLLLGSSQELCVSCLDSGQPITAGQDGPLSSLGVDPRSEAPPPLLPPLLGVSPAV